MFSLKSLVLDPLKGGAHEVLPVPEWDGAEVIVRAPSAGDYAAWRLAIRTAAHIDETDDETVASRKVRDADLSLAGAQLLVRVLYERSGKGAAAITRRVLSDDDVPTLATTWTPVHARLLEKALTLNGITDEADAKNASPESPTSGS